MFKKFEEQNLFQVSCSDIVERFKLILIIGLILLQSNAKDVVYGTVRAYPQTESPSVAMHELMCHASSLGHGPRG